MCVILISIIIIKALAQHDLYILGSFCVTITIILCNHNEIDGHNLILYPLPQLKVQYLPCKWDSVQPLLSMFSFFPIK